MQTTLPGEALLTRYAHDADGPLPHYTDCFTLVAGSPVTLARFVRAFYSTPLFRCERFVLRLAGLSSTDADIDRMLDGRQETFAAWTVEARREHQLLMCDVNGRTRSWFMTVTEGDATRLYFGSAVLSSNGRSLPRRYSALLGPHRMYSRALLRATWRRLQRR